jgi:pseudouridine-5'-phosphate glycosidase
VTEILSLSHEVADALRGRRPVVALETTLVAHGFPRGEGLAVGLGAEEQVRAAGAVPATVGVIDGTIRVGLDREALARFADAGPEARKAGPRDLAACAVQGSLGATTVGGTLAVCRAAGIGFVATGGIGGVHRGFPHPLDVSADLGELARAQVLVVSAGAKSLLDVRATAELLETLGVPVLGYGVDELPLFYAAAGGPPASARIDSAREAAEVARAHWALGRTGMVVARPPDQSLDDVEPLMAEALAEAARLEVAGQALTPFVLGRIHTRSGGRTLDANRDLVLGNAGLAGEIAVAYAGLS